MTAFWSARDRADTGLGVLMPFVRLQLNRVQCWNAESVHGPDFFVCAGSVIHEPSSGRRTATAFTTEMIRARPGTSERPNEVLFDGYTSGARLGLTVVALDMDKNSGWHNNKDDVKRIADDITEAIEKAPFVDDLGGVLGIAVELLYGAIDAIVSADKPDRLGAFTKWLDLPDTIGSKAYREFEVRMRGSDGTGTGLSDWAYVLTFGCSWSTPPPLFGPVASDHLTWEIRQASTVQDWLGSWQSKDNRIAVSIRQSAADHDLVDVAVHRDAKVFEETRGVPISRTFVEAFDGMGSDPDVYATADIEQHGSERIGSFAGQHVDLTLNDGTSGTSVTIERFDGPTGYKEAIFGELLDREDAAHRTQLGADYLWLSRYGLLEIHDLSRDGLEAGPGLIYRWPVQNVALPQSTEVEAELFRSTDIN